MIDLTRQSTTNYANNFVEVFSKPVVGGLGRGQDCHGPRSKPSNRKPPQIERRCWPSWTCLATLSESGFCLGLWCWTWTALVGRCEHDKWLEWCLPNARSSGPIPDEPLKNQSSRWNLWSSYLNPLALTWPGFGFKSWQPAARNWSTIPRVRVATKARTMGAGLTRWQSCSLQVPSGRPVWDKTDQ